MADLPTSTLGRTNLRVTRLGYGAMELRGGRRRTSRTEDVAKLLNCVLDSGINFIDTSPDYGLSEEAIGAHLSHRRGEFLLASKCGCAVGPAPSEGRRPHIFTRENVRAGVEQSLRRMKTDHIDLVQFHISPARSVLEENESVAELEALKQEGKLRFIGMSGTLPHITDHIAMGVFDAFQIPYSAIELEHEETIRSAASAGSGIIVRGGVARGIPVTDESRLESLPEGFRRRFLDRRRTFEAAKLDDLLAGMPRMEFMLRFTISLPEMDTTIVGTANPDHLAANVAAAEKGPLPDDVYAEARKRLQEVASSSV